MTNVKAGRVFAALGIAALAMAHGGQPGFAQERLGGRVGERLGAALFSRLDANGDGRIDTRELEAARRARFARLDANGDGTVSQAEADRAMDRVYRRAMMIELLMADRFDRMDLNGDFNVSEDEFLAAPLSPLHALADADGDGVITRQEFDRALAALRLRLQGRN